MDFIADLQFPLFTWLGQTVTVLEVFGFVTGLLCVWAVWRRWVWNWPVGIANNLAFLVLFLGVGLYADSVLQLAFIALGIVGWISWSRRDARTVTDLRVRRIDRRTGLITLGTTVVGTIGVAVVLINGTDSVVPWPDAFVLVASLVATWLQARRMLEHWYLWIVIDVVSVPLYFAKGLALTAVLYLVFLGLCVGGVLSWRRSTAASDEPAPHQVGVDA
jgi:nicotinamide mononucleotide transporter